MAREMAQQYLLGVTVPTWRPGGSAPKHVLTRSMACTFAKSPHGVFLAQMVTPHTGDTPQWLLTLEGTDQGWLLTRWHASRPAGSEAASCCSVPNGGDHPRASATSSGRLCCLTWVPVTWLPGEQMHQSGHSGPVCSPTCVPSSTQ